MRTKERYFEFLRVERRVCKVNFFIESAGYILISVVLLLLIHLSVSVSHRQSCLQRRDVFRNWILGKGYLNSICA